MTSTQPTQLINQSKACKAKRVLLPTYPTNNYQTVHSVIIEAALHKSIHFILHKPGQGASTAAEKFANGKDEVIILKTQRSKNEKFLYDMLCAVTPGYMEPFSKLKGHEYELLLTRWMFKIDEIETRPSVIIFDHFNWRNAAYISGLFKQILGTVGIVVIGDQDEFYWETQPVKNQVLFQRFIQLAKSHPVNWFVKLHAPTALEIKRIASSLGFCDHTPFIGCKTITELKRKIKEESNK